MTLESKWKDHLHGKYANHLFNKHSIFNTKWAMWKENADKEPVKVESAKSRVKSLAELNVYDNGIQQTDEDKISSFSKINFRNNVQDIINNLYDLLGDSGLNNVQIDYSYTPSDMAVQVYIKDDKRKEVEHKLANMSLV